MSEIRTKWTILTERRDKLAAELAAADRYLVGLENTPLGIDCAGCGEDLPTEAAFAQHFGIKQFDELNNHLNLGFCHRPRVQKSA